MLTFIFVLVMICILYFVRRKLIRQQRIIDKLKVKLDRISAKSNKKTNTKFDWFGRG